MSSTDTPVSHADVEAAIVRLHGALAIGATLDQTAAVSSECPDLLRRLLAERDEWKDGCNRWFNEHNALQDKSQANGVAMLRRLDDWLHGRIGLPSRGGPGVSWIDSDKVGQPRAKIVLEAVQHVVDGLLAEAEKPAEPPKDREGDDVSALQCWSNNPCATCPRTEGGRPPYTTPAGVDRVCGRTACSAGFVCTLPEGHAGDHIAGDGRETIQRWPSEREGDDVLRGCIEAAADHDPSDRLTAGVAELCRRALGEEAR